MERLEVMERLEQGMIDMPYGEGARILIVEDDFEMARLQQFRLEQGGYRAQAVPCLEEAQARIDAGGVDLLLLDHHLPGSRNGLQFYADFTAGGGRIPAILVTAVAGADLAIQSLRAGFRDFIPKSVEYLDYLPQAVRRVLDQVRLEQQLSDSEELHRVTLANVSDTVLITDDAGAFTYVCPNVTVNFGYTAEEVLALKNISRLFGESPVDRARLQRDGIVRNVEREIRTKDGVRRVLLVDAKRVAIQGGTVLYSCRDMTERKRAELSLKEQVQLADLTADVGQSLTTGADLQDMLDRCAEAVAARLDAAVVRIWLYPDSSDELELRASAGAHREREPRGRRIPVKEFGAGWVLRRRRPHISHDLHGDPCVRDREWACREHIAAFGGFPLFLGDQLVGVLELFAPRPLSGAACRTLTCLSRDISLGIARKRTEESLKTANVQIDILVNSIEGIVWEADAQSWDFLFVSRQAERLLGYPVRQWLTEPEFWVRHMHPDDRGWAPDYCQTATNDLKGHEFEYRMTAADGRTVWLRDLVTIEAKDGVPWRLRGIMFDVTAAKLAERRLAAQHRVTRLLSESSTLTEAGPRLLRAICEELDWYAGELWVVSESGRHLRRTATWPDDSAERSGPKPGSAADTLEYGRELPGRVWEAGVTVWEPAANRHRESDSGNGQAATTRSAGQIGIPIRVGEKVVGVVTFSAADAGPPGEPLLAALGTVGSQLGQFMERRRTEKALRLTEEQFRQSQKMEAIGLLAGGVAHDFNNLLTIILGYSEFALDELPADSPVYDCMSEIADAGRRAASLTRQLLAFSRKQVLDPAVVNLNSLIPDFERLLNRVIGEDVQLVTRMAPGLLSVKADAAQIEQTLMNLAVNARDAMPDGGTLTIETRNAVLDENYAELHSDVVPGPYVLLAVSDTGCGMDEETRKRAFEPFFTTKERGKGTGMGLAMIYGIVKQSGGHINIYSEPGRGTTFRIYLPPVEQPPMTNSPRTENEQFPCGAETILLVEDEAPLRQLAQRILESNGYTVISAGSGPDALKLSKSHSAPIDLLITDVVMPEMGGREVAGRLTATRPGLKVLYISGYTDNAVARQGVLDPGTAFLEKPFSRESLTRAVRSTLDESRC